MKTILAVGAGGAIGAVLRYSLTLLIGETSAFPFATLLANLLGCFLLACLMVHRGLRYKMPAEVFTGLTTGVIGSFTTFSAFSVETVTLYQLAPGQAVLYAGISLFGGLTFAYLGVVFSRKKGRV